MPHSVHRGTGAVGSMSPPDPEVAPVPPAAAPRWQGSWLPAADLPLDEERAATVSFDRRGRCRLTLAVDRPAAESDLAALEEAADVLPNLHLFDLDDTGDYPERHAEAFGLPRPLSPDAFNRSAEVELLAPPGGLPLPRRLGRFAVPAVSGGSGATGGPGAVDNPGPSVPGSATLPHRGTRRRTGWVKGGSAAERGIAAERGTAAGFGTAAGHATGAEAGYDAATGYGTTVGYGAAAGYGTAFGSRFELALLGLGRRLVEATRVSGAGLCALALGTTLTVFVAAFVAATWTAHARFGTYGFDLGIYDQATWLLSRGRAPSVTIRGLDLFGQHAAYIMVLVAPLYRLWADPRLLLLLQVLFLALPAVVLYRVGGRHLGHPAAGLAVAVAYLAYPGVQWAISWQFHPEAIAAGLLALAVLAADRGRYRAMAVWLALAALCGEEVGLVVAGFGLLLVAGGRRTVGWRTAGAGLGWFLLATYVLEPLHAGRVTRLFETDYGIAGTGPLALLGALPTMAGHALQTGMANDGLFYLLLVFLPLLGLPLLAPRWLWPVAPALLLNLAAVQPEHHQLRFHYLATAAPLLAAGAVAGLARVRSARRPLLAPLLVLLVVVACFTSWRYGPAPWARDPVAIPAGPTDQARRQALALVPEGAPVSAQYNLVPHLGHRVEVYEFPNPFRAVNWGLAGDEHPPEALERLRFVVVQRDLLGDQDRQLLDRLQAGSAWRTVMDRQDVVVLERREPVP
ncbi:MAG: DUF2079 domain-containing protein [Actinomycetota bacterium]